MLRFQRPPQPDDFEARVADARRNVESAVKAGRTPAFPPLWKDYKIHFARAQYRKCGFCDRGVSDTGHLEHYRPKGAVTRLSDNLDDWGTEIEGGANVERPRHAPEISPRGYYWLAYVWSNYLFACERCNSAWKGNLFPVSEGDRVVPPEPGGAETPLLLNPFDEQRDPVEHLAYDDLGHIRPWQDSDSGWETIRTCFLDRESLRSRREEKAKRAHRLVIELSEARGEGRQQALQDLLEMGDAGRDFAGMVRSIFEQKTGYRWSDAFPTDGYP